MNACSLWFDGIGPWNWGECCARHDWAYAHQLPKALADAALAHCVNNILPGMGIVMWFGVTLFGAAWYALARKRSQS